MKRTVPVYLMLVVLTGFAAGAWAEEAAPAATAQAAAIDAAVTAKVKTLIADGGYYYSVGQFEKALELADAALKLDPSSAAAKQLKEICDEAVKARDSKDWVPEQRREFQRAVQQVNRDKVGQPEVLRHGPDWPLVKQRAGGVYGPAAEIQKENREINAQLEAVKVSADFRGTPLAEVVTHLATLSKLNIQVDPRARAGEKAATDVEVTFHATNMKLKNVLSWVTRLNDLKYTVRDEVILITDTDHLEEFKVTAVYDISDITAPIPDYQSVPEFDVTLPAINARRIGYGFYQVPYSWYWRGVWPFTGAYFVDFAEQPRYFMTEDEVRNLIEKLIEGEE